MFHELTVARVDQLCADAAALTFDVPQELAREFSFAAGQSLTVRRIVDGRDERRSYSICSAVGNTPRIGVRVVENGAVSGWLVRQVRAGDQVEVQPPAGTFGAAVRDGMHHVVIAAGSGITPVLSIANSILHRAGTELTLLYGNRRADSVMLADEVAELKDAHPDRVNLVHVLSREAQEVDLFNGRIDATKLRTLLPMLGVPSSVDHWWLCGPFGMITDAIEVLTEFGVPRDRIHRELFYVEELPPEQAQHDEPTLRGGSEVTVVLNGRTTVITIARDTPVLDGAQGLRPDLPFACRGGVCGTCRARLVTGEVRMRRNFALEPDELEAGYVLTCQSLPVSDQLTVDFDS
ncbi:MAG: 1,2-phenylacetyl-CoA epoxidase subunit PaaE [Jatrophihabitantaceae bacterium]